MANEKFPDSLVKANILSEYGQALATVAEALLRYPDVVSRVSSDGELCRIDSQYARVIRRTLASRPIALAVLEGTDARMAPRSNLLGFIRNVCAYIGRILADKILSRGRAK